MSTFADAFPDTPRARAPRRKAAPGKGHNLPRASERQIQMAIIEALRLHGVYSAHVPNAGKRGPVAARRLKEEGMRTGFPDLITFARGRCALIEVKAGDNRPSPAQRECHADLLHFGVQVFVAYCIEDALEACRVRGLIG